MKVTSKSVVLLPADCQVHGLMLAGGVIQDATLAKQTAASVRAVYAPKVEPFCLLFPGKPLLCQDHSQTHGMVLNGF